MVASKKHIKAKQDFLNSLVNADQDYAVNAIGRISNQIADLMDAIKEANIPIFLRTEWSKKDGQRIFSIFLKEMRSDILEIQLQKSALDTVKISTILVNPPETDFKFPKSKDYPSLNKIDGVNKLSAFVGEIILNAVSENFQQSFSEMFNGISKMDREEFEDFQSMYETIKWKFSGDTKAYLETAPDIKSEI